MVLDGHVADLLIVSARSAGDDDARDGLTLFCRRRARSRPHRHAQPRRRQPQRRARPARRRRRRRGGRARRPCSAAPRSSIRCSTAPPSCSPPRCWGASKRSSSARWSTSSRAGSSACPSARSRRCSTAPRAPGREIELTRALVGEALRAVDGDDAAVTARLACAAKARASDAFMLVRAEAVQMHGGLGVTDELDIGLFYKRAHVAAQLLGDSAYQRDRFARLSGY